MTASSGDTIFALSTGTPPSGVAVIRLSGDGALAALRQIVQGDPPAVGRLALRALIGADGEEIDKGMVVAFRGPKSFTGEDCGELHVHGSRAVVAALAKRLVGLGLRPAEPGEFARRAFRNGKIDLTEAEGLADLIEAETEEQRRLALTHASGDLHALYAAWRDRLLTLRAELEAELDFSDEEDVAMLGASVSNSDIEALRCEILAHCDSFAAGRIIRDGLKVAVIGPPNSGKSSLFNRLARHDIALVTDVAGTTRDVLEVALDIGGYKVSLFDTAGIRETNDRVEALGVERAHRAARDADLIISLCSIDSNGGWIETGSAAPEIRCYSRCDLTPRPRAGALNITVRLADGVDPLLEALRAHLLALPAQDVMPARMRHVAHLKAAAAELELAGEQCEIEMRAEHLRRAALELAQIIGMIGVEDVLGEIFARFCIGK